MGSFQTRLHSLRGMEHPYHMVDMELDTLGRSDGYFFQYSLYECGVFALSHEPTHHS